MRNLNKYMISSTANMHNELGIFENFVLTQDGSLIGAIQIQGKDPDGLNYYDYQRLTIFTRHLFQNLPNNIIITQYYHHYNNTDIKLVKRNDEICNLLSTRRQKFLNTQQLSKTSIIYYLEILPNSYNHKFTNINLFLSLCKSLFKTEAREILKHSLSQNKILILCIKELQKLAKELQASLSELIIKWQSISNAKQLTIEEIWQNMLHITNLETQKLSNIKPPTDNWHHLLAYGDREEVTIQNMNLLKFYGCENSYARIAAITRFGREQVSPGIWSINSGSPTRQAGNYLIVTRFAPLSHFQKTLLFNNKKSEIYRRSMKFKDLLYGEHMNKTSHLNQKLQEQLIELETAEDIEDRWGMLHSFVILYNKDPNRLQEYSLKMQKSLHQNHLQFCWENIDLPNAWQTCLPAGYKKSMRDIPFTTTQFGATSFLYQSTEGQVSVADMNNEEAQYIFVSEDKTPFYYNPFVKGRAIVFGVGPIRSGKSFTKNTLAAHFLKYDGILRTLDIDSGTETLAKNFRSKSGIFKIDSNNCGFNPFISALSPNDLIFVQHLKQQILNMLSHNDNITLQTLEVYEQKELDKAIMATLKLPSALQTLSNVFNHCSYDLQNKMQRWIKGGIYGNLFDQEIDSIGSFDKQIAVFNLAGIKNDKIALPLVMTEIFFRITRLFENNKYKLLPKFLDIDEAHLLLKNNYIVKQITQYVRTWGKWHAGIGLWTQSPKEFADLPDWPALCSAASTFFFMADPAMDRNLYINTFKLTDGECKAIQDLVPKREAYIIQREIGVSKKVILEVEREQYIISTSTPHEVVLRDNNIEKLGFQKGIYKTIEDLNKE